MLSVTNFKLGIGIPISIPFIDSDFHNSFLNMEKPEYVALNANHGEIPELRNAIMIMARRACCSHVIMLDTDMIYPKDTITKLLEHKDKMVVGALCFRRYPPFEPVMQKGKKNILEWQDGELLEVDRTGTGCIMINMQVLNYIKKPYFRKVTNDDGLVIQGEDYYFCDKVKNAGLNIYVDTSIECEHLAKITINTKFWRMWKTLNQ